MTRILKIILAMGTGLVWANDTDAEILKDLDFFMNFEMLLEDSALEEGNLEEGSSNPEGEKK